MMKFNILFLFILFFSANILSAQLKYEKEFRIRKTQFPEKALVLVQEKLTDAKRLKFYKEIDGNKTRFGLKFKKDRLWYSIEFTGEGNLENVKIQIQDIDILDESYAQIVAYLKQNFSSYKIKKIQQQYIANGSTDEILKTAFQNLITPHIKYPLVVRAKKDTNGFKEYKILFNAEGKCISSRKSLPPNYDHILY